MAEMKVKNVVQRRYLRGYIIMGLALGMVTFLVFFIWGLIDLDRYGWYGWKNPSGPGLLAGVVIIIMTIVAALGLLYALARKIHALAGIIGGPATKDDC